MLVFAAFVAVLIIAGIGFRLGPRRSRRRPVVVFGISSALVIASAAGILIPDSVPGFRHAASASGAAGSAQAGTGQRLVPRIQPAVRGMPLTYASGGSSGGGLARAAARTLVLYDATGSEAGGAELAATALANLVSHFGSWTAHPVYTYRSGEMAAYGAVIYLGAATGGQLPAEFLDDVEAASRPVMWVNDDIAQLRAHDQTWNQRRGFTPHGFGNAQFVRVDYKGIALPIHQVSGAGIMRVTIDGPAKATVLATAVRADGITTPWAVRAGNLIYVAENPLSDIGYSNDRYLAFADLLFEAVAPDVPERHRALIRLEDVGPTADPVALRAVTDFLFSQHIPFSVAVYPVYRDPNGVSGGGDVTIRLSERPAVVAALKYAASHGGSLILHGYTHQYGTKNNPNNGQSGDDAEFYLAHLDGTDIRLDGPVPEDSDAWALGRLDQGLGELQKEGLPRPLMFEFPHYMASPTDYLAAFKRFPFRYERSLYFPGLLSGRPVDSGQRLWQFFPYTVRDVYGTTVIPENLDYVQSNAGAVADMVDTARSNLAVRDGVASFFYHPFLGVGQLPQLVDGIRGLGYTFVSAEDLATAK
jgi:uncharacterized protein YdaL